MAAFVDVKTTEQLLCGPVTLATRTQLPNGTLLPSAVKVTVPVGALLVPVSVSVTVAVQLVVSPAWIEAGEHVTAVAVERFVTVTDVLPSLGKCVVSPLYVAVIVCEPVPTALGVYVTKQLEEPAVPPSVHATLLNVPTPEL